MPTDILTSSLRIALRVICALVDHLEQAARSDRVRKCIEKASRSSESKQCKKEIRDNRTQTWPECASHLFAFATVQNGSD